MLDSYEMVIGLEVHVELKTQTKIFCSCDTSFGQAPNTQTCPVCLGLPGSLPVLNKKAVEYAVRAGLATECEIRLESKQDRKNYFYPDLAKAYQISQYDQPLCEKGRIVIHPGYEKEIGITRIHIEEDAGKLVHHPKEGTLIDYNRAGVPLIEIVSEPDMRSAIEAKMYLQKLRGIILYTGVSDCKMNEGSFRVDVNLSVRKKGSQVLGTRTEMKNLNSFTSVVKAIDHEFQRQVKLLESGGSVIQETRKWDQEKNKSIAMRSKEDAHDYRYFPDPDLSSIRLQAAYVEDIKSALPELPDVKISRYVKEYDISKEVAEIICIDPARSLYFEDVLMATEDPVTASHIFTGEVLKILDKKEIDIPEFQASYISKLVDLIHEKVINTSIAKRVIQQMFSSLEDPVKIIDQQGLYLIKDEELLKEKMTAILTKQPQILIDYKQGKTKALQALIGQIMKETKGLADPETIEILFKAHLE